MLRVPAGFKKPSWLKGAIHMLNEIFSGVCTQKAPQSFYCLGQRISGRHLKPLEVCPCWSAAYSSDEIFSTEDVYTDQIPLSMQLDLSLLGVHMGPMKYSQPQAYLSTQSLTRPQLCGRQYWNTLDLRAGFQCVVCCQCEAGGISSVVKCSLSIFAASLRQVSWWG